MRPRALLYRARSLLKRREVTSGTTRPTGSRSAASSRTGHEPRRADYAIWWLAGARPSPRLEVRIPRRASYADLARVHAPELLESLGRPETLAAVFGVDPSDVPVDEVMRTVRLACGATLAAAREALRTRQAPASTSWAASTTPAPPRPAASAR